MEAHLEGSQSWNVWSILLDEEAQPARFWKARRFSADEGGYLQDQPDVSSQHLSQDVSSPGEAFVVKEKIAKFSL